MFWASWENKINQSGNTNRIDATDLVIGLLPDKAAGDRRQGYDWVRLVGDSRNDVIEAAALCLVAIQKAAMNFKDRIFVSGLETRLEEVLIANGRTTDQVWEFGERLRDSMVKIVPAMQAFRDDADLDAMIEIYAAVCPSLPEESLAKIVKDSSAYAGSRAVIPVELSPAPLSTTAAVCEAVADLYDRTSHQSEQVELARSLPSVAATLVDSIVIADRVSPETVGRLIRVAEVTNDTTLPPIPRAC